MNRKIIVIAALGTMLGLSGSALAEEPSSAEACSKTSFSLAKKLAAKKLPEADAVKIDEMIVKLDGQCAEKKLAEAGATIKEIEAALKK